MYTNYENETNLFEVRYIIYEKNDSAILLNGTMSIDNKKYFTSIPLEPIRFSFLCEQAIGYEKTNLMWSLLFDKYDPICEICPQINLGIDIFITKEDLGISNNQVTLKTA